MIDFMWSRRRELAVVLFLGALVAAPFFVGDSLLSIFISGLILALFASGFNLLFGYTGLLSFGHAAFYGAGAYGVALSLKGSTFIPETGSLIPALLVAVVFTVVVAAIVGIICVQRGAFAFAMLTLVVNMVFYQLVFEFRDVTGGSDGTVLPTPTVDLGFVSFTVLDTGLYYYLVLGIVVLTLFLLWRVVNSPYGEILQAIRENDERASFSGLRVKYYQWSAFVLSGAVAGLAGGLISIQQFVVSPDILYWAQSAQPVLVTLIGGPSYFLGPVVGAVVYILLEDVVTGITQFWQFVLGVVLLLIVLFAPDGVIGRARELLTWLGGTVRSGGEER
jgi:branched-chain amino acid transport system permease protein